MTIPCEGKARRRRLAGRRQAADYLDVTLRTLDRMIARGLLNRVRLPGVRRTLLDLADLDRLVDEAKRSGPQR